MPGSDLRNYSNFTSEFNRKNQRSIDSQVGISFHKELDSTRYKNFLKINPLRLFTAVNPAVEISYERRTGNRFATQVSGSALLPAGLISIAINDHDKGMEGYRFALEEKFYFKNSAFGPYVGLEFEHLRARYRMTAMFEEPESEIQPDTMQKVSVRENVGVKKEFSGFRFKLGIQEKIGKSFAFDVFIAMGPRYRVVQHFDKENPDYVLQMPRHPNIYYATNAEGREWVFNVNLGFRIAYFF